MPHGLSIFIIALNEADRIAATLAAVRDLTNDIIVVDAGSTDGTQDIAREFGCTVVHRVWSGYGEQKRFAESLCTHDWVLNVDADEVVSAALRESIRETLASEPAYDAYRVRIVAVMAGKLTPPPFAYEMRPVRLYRRSRGSYSASPVHDRVVLDPDASIGRLSGRLLHYSARSIDTQIAKFNTYSSSLVLDMEARGRRLRGWRLYTEFCSAFFKAFFGRRYCFAGSEGFVAAMNYAYFRFMRVAKWREAETRRKTSSAGSR